MTQYPVAETPVEQIHIPHRSISLGTDVGVPLAQAGVEGALVGILALVLVLAADAAFQPARWLPALAYALGLAFVVLVVALYRWPGHLRDARSTTWEYRRVPLDLNGDGKLQPNERKRPIYVDGKLPQQSATDHVYNDRLREFIGECRAIQAPSGRKLVARGWSEDEVEIFTAHLITHGGAHWRNPKAPQLGWELADDKEIVRVMLHTIWL